MHNNSQINHFHSISKSGKFWRVTILPPLRWISPLRFGRGWSKRYRFSAFGFFSTSSCSSIVLIRIPLYFAYLLILLQVTYQTNSGILTDTPNNTQVTPIFRPPFLFSPYLIDLFLHMFTFQRSLTNILIRRRFYYQSLKH